MGQACETGLSIKKRGSVLKKRVLMRKARRAVAYWTYTKGAHRA